MHSILRKKYYELETQCVIATKNGNSFQEFDEALHRTGEEIVGDVHNKLLNSVTALVDLVSPLYFSSEFLKRLSSTDPSSLGNPISEREFNVARDFVENCLKVNLNKVEWLHIENQIRKSSEGFCISNRDDEHFIFTQDDPFGVTSTDLFVHELGHAADFSISRACNDDSLLIRHISLCETIAYYCQYRYLSESGNPVKRQGSLGTLLFLYLCISTVRYCLNNDVSLNDFDPEVDIDGSDFYEIIDSYNKRGMNGREYISGILNESVKRYGELTYLIFREIAPKFGLILAILFLDSEPEHMIELINTNTINTDLDTFVHAFIPDYFNKINSFESYALKYIDNA
ncbi:hypothetical protein [Enterobacter roggenkampii]|uniref:hypothetical protein n=1 Tax=Enterobacter roggenkampii TaxID=1812935 RepID=UPI003D6E2846